jgi:hypothetical protein
LHVAGGFLWAVYGTTLYRISSNWSATSVGALPNDTGHVEIFDNGIDLVVAHQDGWHTCLLAGGSLAGVSGSEATSDGTFIDSYFVQAKEDGTYQWADVGTTTIDALSVLNGLLAELYEAGIGLPQYSVASLSETLTLDAADLEAIAYQLAIRIAPEYGLAPTQQHMATAAQAMFRLRQRYLQPSHPIPAMYY